MRAARNAGQAPPSRPSSRANETEQTRTNGVTRKAKATSVKVWKLVVPVLIPLSISSGLAPNPVQNSF